MWIWGSAAANHAFKLQSSGGKETLLAADGRGQVRDLSLTSPGIYTLRDEAGNETRRLAVNTPIQESDLTAIPAKDLNIARVTEGPATTLTAGLFGASSNQKEFWRVLLMAAVVLLFVEMFVANRTLA